MCWLESSACFNKSSPWTTFHNVNLGLGMVSSKGNVVFPIYTRFQYNGQTGKLQVVSCFFFQDVVGFSAAVPHVERITTCLS